MIRTTAIGNLVREPETHTFSDGTKVCNFDIAVSRYVNGEQVTQYMQVHTYGRTGENCMKYLTKGSKIYVDGRPDARAYSSRDGKPKASMEIYANSVEFLSTPKREATAEADADGFTEIEDDEIPY